MNTINRIEDYDIKRNRVYSAFNLKQTDTVPIITMNGTWGFAYSNVQIKDVLYDPRKTHEAMLKFCDEVYSDMIASAAVIAPLQMYEQLETPEPMYCITADGFSLEHRQSNEGSVLMKPEEYPQLIANKEKYILKTLAPRRHPALSQPYPQNYEILKKGYDGFIKYLECMATGRVTAKELYGLPMLGDSVVHIPVEKLVGGYRGLKGLLTDIRRYPQMVLDAIDVFQKKLRKVWPIHNREVRSLCI